MTSGAACHLLEIIFAFGHFRESPQGKRGSARVIGSAALWTARGTVEKLLLFPSSLLWLLNLVQKELTSKRCSEIHNSRGSVYFIVSPAKGMSEKSQFG